MVYNWNQNGLSVFFATSSIEQIDIVEKFADGASVDEICEFVESLASGAHAAWGR